MAAGIGRRSLSPAEGATAPGLVAEHELIQLHAEFARVRVLPPPGLIVAGAAGHPAGTCARPLEPNRPTPAARAVLTLGRQR
jgi:hypothetical protein